MKCKWNKRSNTIKELKHPKCPGENLEIEITAASTVTIDKAISNFVRILNISFDVAASPEMKQIIIE